MSNPKATIESGVAEIMQQLSVSPPRHGATIQRSATPPRQFQQMSRYHQSSPSLMDASPCENKESTSPVMMVRRQVGHHEMTPVMRNTTYFADESTNMVSPEDSVLCRDGLSLDLAGSSSRPPLQRRSMLPPPIPMVDRTRSLGNVEDFDEEDDEDFVEPAIDFPSRKKFFSFNSRHQYHKQTSESSQHQHQSSSAATPYQPTRHDLSDVGALPREELNRIFIHREQLGHPFSMEERQYSIPSIHLATQLNESTTDYTDEEDALDDASWSSRGSSLYLPEEYEVPTPTALKQVLRFTPTSTKPMVVVEGHLSEIFIPNNNNSHNIVTDNNNNDQATVDAVASSKRAKHEKVYEWLRTVEGDHEIIAEAASSKFLTRRPMGEVLSRQKSSPAEVN
mmetsp:Transcript_29024/g.47941  ORF Transcript_29024/g.47941 Transcript_29024/m.47941 type:complete len:394 (-) Transcript_29024:132-1313(-)